MGNARFRVAALFAGIGGIELGFKRALGDEVETLLFCESWKPAQDVLASRFGDVDLHPDVRELVDVPADTTVITAGFPCTDLSQAGRTAGIAGTNSGLVAHVFDALRTAAKSRSLPTLIVENVPNMLALDSGRAMAYLVDEIESLGYRWAYRVVDTRMTGLPQRRRRVILVASVDLDPREVLFADDAGARPDHQLSDDAFGFFWTEGKTGLGWAVDAVPTIKGGSTIGIASPPAIWVPGAVEGRRFVKPLVEDGEALQGFPRGWTRSDDQIPRKNGIRWKLVGNAVTVDVAEWLGGRLASPGEALGHFVEWNRPSGSWPKSAWGESGKVWANTDLSEFPIQKPYLHLRDIVDTDAADTLTLRGTAGFWNRLGQGNLGRFPGFRDDIVSHIDALTYERALAV